MRQIYLLALLATAAGPAAHAQAISLDKLVSLSALGPDLTPAGSGQAELPGWVFRLPTPQAQEEPLTWAWSPAAEQALTPPVAQLSLRPNHQSLDVLLYLRRVQTFNRLRRELDRQHLTPAAVTCLGAGCTGERYAAATYTVAFYQGKPGDYPYMVVIQAKAPAPHP